MALSEAKKAADKRHMDKLDNIMVRPYREEGAAIRAAAAAAGMSVQRYILCAVRAWMEKDLTGAIPPDASPAVSPEGMRAGSMSIPGSGFNISGSPEEKVCGQLTSLTSFNSAAGRPVSAVGEEATPESEQLQQTLEDRPSWSCQGVNEEVDDLRARLRRSLNRSGTIEVIKRMKEVQQSEQDLFQRVDSESQE